MILSTTFIPTRLGYIPAAAGLDSPATKRTPLFSYWSIAEDGIAYDTCEDINLSASLHSYAGEYQKPLNQLGLRLEKSIGLNYLETVSEISGNRSRVQFAFACTTYAGTPMSGVNEITLQRAYKTTKRRVVETRGTHRIVKWLKVRIQYSLATSTRCPAIATGTIAAIATPKAMLAAQRQATSIKMLTRYSVAKLTPQSITNQVEYALPVNNKYFDPDNYPGQPIASASSAYIYPVKAGFASNCHKAAHGSSSEAWQYVTAGIDSISENYSWRLCNIPIDRVFQSSQLDKELENAASNGFQRNLNNIGNRVLKSVGIKQSETAEWITATPAKATVVFAAPRCLTSSATAGCYGVTKVVIVRARLRAHGRMQWYSKATLTLVEATR